MIGCVSGQRWVPWVVYAWVLIVAPLVFSSDLGLSLLSQMGIAVIACLSYNLLLREGGMLSLGHAVYSGIGAFGAIHALNGVAHGVPLPVGLVPVVGGFSGMLAALFLGLAARTTAPFAMITLGIGELVWTVALMWPGFFGGESGVSGDRTAGSGIGFGPLVRLYDLIAVYTFVCTVLMFAFRQTPLGRMLNAVRDNPKRVEFVGYDPGWVRCGACVVAGFFAGVSGGLAALHFEIVTVDAVSAYRSGLYLLFTVLGGVTLFWGPMLGAVLMVLTQVWLSEVTRAWLLYMGLTFIGVVMYAPGGVASLIVWGWRLARDGLWKRLWASSLALGTTAVVGCVGVAAMIEMVYRARLGTPSGASWLWWAIPIDGRDVDSWVGAAWVSLTGWGLFGWIRPQFLRDWKRIVGDRPEGVVWGSR